MSEELFNKNKIKFEKLIELFQIENSKINLSSFNDRESILNKHVLDSLNIFNLEFFQELLNSNKKITIGDIGTGGGFPGLPLAIILPNCDFYLIESITKKCRAIEEMAKGLNLNNIKVINKRAEDIKEQFDVTVSRAVADFSRIYKWSFDLTKNDGRIYLYKSLKEEIEGFSSKKEYNINDDKRVIYEFLKS